LVDQALYQQQREFPKLLVKLKILLQTSTSPAWPAVSALLKVVFTAPWWCADYLAIPSSCRRVSVYNPNYYLQLGITSGSHHCLPLWKNLWHVTIAHSIRAMRACCRPQLMVLVVPYPARFA